MRHLGNLHSFAQASRTLGLLRDDPGGHRSKNDFGPLPLPGLEFLRFPGAVNELAFLEDLRPEEAGLEGAGAPFMSDEARVPG